MKSGRIILMIMLLLAAPLSIRSATRGGGHIKFKRTVCNMGDIPRRGGDISADFEFENDGDEPIVITRVTTSCTCVKADFSRRPVKVNGKGVVRVTYEPHKMSPGNFYKTVQVHFKSSGRQQNAILVMQGNSVDNR
ncbi:MAG: DUF1573 domain-containing protein [Alistipes sp.]|nr:DUF1573 domain-containing protein [Alistipes sp.]